MDINNVQIICHKISITNIGFTIYYVLYSPYSWYAPTLCKFWSWCKLMRWRYWIYDYWYLWPCFRWITFPKKCERQLCLIIVSIFKQFMILIITASTEIVFKSAMFQVPLYWLQLLSIETQNCKNTHLFAFPLYNTQYKEL